MLSAEPARLFEPVPPWRPLHADAAHAATMADGETLAAMRDSLRIDPADPERRVIFRQTMRMNEKAIGAPLEFNLEGAERRAWLVDAYEREDGSGTSYFYATDYASDGEEGLLSAFTTFADGRPSYAYVVMDGKGYFVSPTDGGRHVVTRTLYGRIREDPRMSAPRPHAAVATLPEAWERSKGSNLVVAPNKSRACCASSHRIQLSVVVNTGAKNPYDLTDRGKVHARVTHYFDRMNTALRNSGGSVYLYFKEINYLAFPDSVPDDGYLEWGQQSPEVEAIRARLQAAGTLLLLGRFVQHESVVLEPGPGNLAKPSYRVSVGGGYLRDDLDGDVHTTMHETGHFLGMEHQFKWSRAGRAGLPPGPLPRYGWDSCERLEHCAMSYADCGRAMRTVEIFSGYRAQKMGYPIDLATQNSVAVSNMVGRELARPWP